MAKNPIPEAVSETSRGLLAVCLATLQDLHSQLKQAHWNVQGSTFYSLHKLFDKLAGGVLAQADDVAERIVQLGGTALGTVRESGRKSILPEPSASRVPTAILASLVEAFASVSGNVRSYALTAERSGDVATLDVFTQVLREIDKGLFFLESSQ